MDLDFIKKHRKNILLCLLGIAFFVIYSYLIFGNGNLRFSWPDEMANYFSAGQFARTNHPYSQAAYADIAGALVSPRSMLVWQDKLVPVGFLGMPLLWGIAAKVIGTFAILFLTPLLAVLGAYFFYRLLKLYFEEPVALLSGILLLFLPAYWYYASFVMLPNVAMISFLIIGLYLLAAGLKEGRPWYFQILAGLALGAALIIRPNEVIWILPLCIVFLAVERKNIKIRSLSIVFLSSLFLIVLLAIFQSSTYGHWFLTGYSLSIPGEKSPGVVSLGLTAVAPFGFNFFLAVKNIATFVIVTHWLIFLLAFAGAFMAMIREKRSAWKVLLGVSLSLCFFLGMMYGSWKLNDDLILNISRLGVSYNRYLLPGMGALIPFVAYLIVRIYRMEEKFAKFSAILLVLVCMLFGISKVYFTGNDSLPRIKQSIAEYNTVHEKILELTPENAVIETFRGDKIVFPERQVVAQYSHSDDSFRSNLMESLPYYILSIDNETYQGLNLLLGNVGIEGKRAVKVEDLAGKYSLYKVVDGEPDSPQPFE